jgi:hypothetical protein
MSAMSSRLSNSAPIVAAGRLRTARHRNPGRARSWTRRSVRLLGLRLSKMGSGIWMLCAPLAVARSSLTAGSGSADASAKWPKWARLRDGALEASASVACYFCHR